MSSIPTKECARGSHRTPFTPLHPGKLAFFSAVDPVSGIAPSQWSGSPRLPGEGTGTGDMGNNTPPVVWFKRGPGTVVEIRPILIEESNAETLQGQFRVFTASREPSNADTYQFQAQHVCNCVATGGGTQLLEAANHVALDPTYASIVFAKTITVGDDKSLPPGVKVLGDYGEGPASIVFDAGGAEWIGIAGAALAADNTTTGAVDAIAFDVRSW